MDAEFAWAQEMTDALVGNARKLEQAYAEIAELRDEVHAARTETRRLFELHAHTMRLLTAAGITDAKVLHSVKVAP